MKLPDRGLRKEEMAMESANRTVKHTLRAKTDAISEQGFEEEEEEEEGNMK